MAPAETMHRLSIAIEAMGQCREHLRHAHMSGGAVGEALVSVIAAQAQVELVLREMVDATEEEAA